MRKKRSKKNGIGCMFFNRVGRLLLSVNHLSTLLHFLMNPVEWFVNFSHVLDLLIAITRVCGIKRVQKLIQEFLDLKRSTRTLIVACRHGLSLCVWFVRPLICMPMYIFFLNYLKQWNSEVWSSIRRTISWPLMFITMYHEAYTTIWKNVVMIEQCR